MVDRKFEDILKKNGFAHVATVGPRGEPHNTPVWYRWDGKHLLISQRPDRAKFKNMKRDPRVAVSITDPDDPYRRIELRGHVTEIRRDKDRSFVNSLAKTYTNEDEYRYDEPGTKRYVIEITPDRVTTQAA